MVRDTTKAIIRSDKKCIGAPVYFFFHLNTADLTEPSQTLNLDELASLACDYRLHITIIGAADSARERQTSTMDSARHAPTSSHMN